MPHLVKEPHLVNNGDDGLERKYLKDVALCAPCAIKSCEWWTALQHLVSIACYFY